MWRVRLSMSVLRGRCRPDGSREAPQAGSGSGISPHRVAKSVTHALEKGETYARRAGKCAVDIPMGWMDDGGRKRQWCLRVGCGRVCDRTIGLVGGVLALLPVWTSRAWGRSGTARVGLVMPVAVNALERGRCQMAVWTAGLRIARGERSRSRGLASMRFAFCMFCGARLPNGSVRYERDVSTV